MRLLGACIVISLFDPAAALAQERDRSLERVGIAIQQPAPLVRAFQPPVSDFPRKLGEFTLVSPVLRGEMVRVSLPVGEYVMRAARGVASANRRRQEAAARRRVEAAISAFAR